MIGTTIGHYKIESKLGEGGMGVVYKATDTKLDRTVALKFLPEQVSTGSDELERFIQEAKAAAGLSHPNICTIHGIEEAENKHFIVMEFVDGQTLQEKKSSLSMKQALDVGIQIAEGLAAAHEKGIVHRDIKPENIMFRKDGRVQIMDFGLAKLRGASRLTKEGSTVGTAGYMSPEQVQGQDTDHRSDIFSLGVLIYEMLTGQPPFKGMHETAVAYEVVNLDSAPMTSVKPEIAPELDAVVLECLEKDPRERTQSASQVAVDLKRCRRESSRQRASRTMSSRSSQTAAPVPHQNAQGLTGHTTKKNSVPWVLAGVIGVVGILVGYGISWIGQSREVNRPAIRAAIEMPEGVQYLDALGGNSVISPDGSMIAFVGVDSLSQQMLWTRPLQSNESRALPGTEHAGYPFWSHDSKTIGFFSDGKLKSIAAAGGPVLTLADAPFGRGASWSRNGVIVFAPSVTEKNFLAVPSTGGAVEYATTFDTSSSTVPRFPFFLPDGDRFLFSVLTLEGDNRSDIYVGSVSTKESKKVLDDAASAVYALGYILYLRQGILMAQPFDVGSAVASGKPVAVEGKINAWLSRAKADFSSSEEGILLHASGLGRSQSTEFVWIDDAGTESSIIQTRNFMSPSLSPDGRKIAYVELNEQRGSDIWIYDVARKVRTRFTFGDQNAALMPVWSSDGSSIFYNAEIGSGKSNILVKAADGVGEAKLIAHSEENVAYFPEDVSPDGKFLLFSIQNESMSELATVDLRETSRPIPVAKLGVNGRHARFSPDGRWIVYRSDVSEDSRILVTEFGKRSGTWQVSPEAGTDPLWAGNRVTYFATKIGQFMGVDVSLMSESPSFSTPRPLFPGNRGRNLFLEGISRDGSRYFGLRPVNAGINSHLSILVNWPSVITEQ